MLKPLAEIRFPDLVSFDRQTLVDEIIYRMQSDPDWSALWDGNLHQNASQSIIQFFAYLFEKNAYASNRWVRETFLNKSFSESAIYENIKQMRISSRQNKEASVELFCTITNGYLDEPLIIPRFFKIKASDINNQPTTFEIIKKESNKYNYLESVIIQPGTFARDNFVLMAYSGETATKEYLVDETTLENFKIGVEINNIIDGSVAVFYKTTGGAMIELIKTDSFVVAPYVSAQSMQYFPNGIPHYIVNYGKNGTIELIFGSKDFGGAFDETHVNGALVIFCRTGGGSADNITAGAISTTQSIYVNNNRSLSVNFQNIHPAFGGQNREATEIIKQFAPYRYGRGDKKIIDEIDALKELQGVVVKHKIETPFFSEVASTVQLLHAVHKIVPKRLLGEFSAPQPLPTDTIETYTVKLLYNLNVFLNVVGTHDKPIKNEFVTTFTKTIDSNGDDVYKFVYMPEYSKPLSGSLSLTAWNYMNEIVDHITFDGNYYTSEFIVGSASSDHALVSTLPFSTLNIMADKNNFIALSFDNSSYVFNIELPTGPKTAKELADAMQAAIVNLINFIPEANTAFFEYRTFEFVSYRETNAAQSIGLIEIRSPRVGSESKVTLLDNGLQNNDPLTNLYTLLGISERIYRAPLSTELVFDRNCLFYVNTNEIEVSINKLYLNVTERRDWLSAWEQSVIEEAGPIIDLVLIDENVDRFQQLQVGTDIIVSAIDDNDNVLDFVTFPDVAEIEENSPEFSDDTHTIFNPDSTEFSYDYLTSTIKLQLVNGVQVDVYSQTYSTIYKIMVRRVEWDGSSAWIPVDTEENWSVVEFFEPNHDWTQNILSDVGPIITLDISTISVLGFEQGKSYEVRVYKMPADSLTAITINKIRFVNVDLTLGNVESTTVEQFYGETIIDPFGNNYYDPTAKTITLKTQDPVVNTTADAYYVPGYTTFSKIKIQYMRKSYNHITTDYTPNPYSPELEAKDYVDRLMDPSKRLISLENIIKTINFLPIGVEITLYVNKNFSLTDAIQNAEYVVRKYFSYINLNHEHEIGTLISDTSIRSAIIRDMPNFGIIDIVCNMMTDVTVLSSEIKNNTYFFIADDSFIKQLEEVELANSNISGVSSLFKLTVRAVRRD